MDLLKNELVVKYFGFGYEWCSQERREEIISKKILSAMHEPIRKGDHYLWITSKGIQEMECRLLDHGEWHPDSLRLPDAHQMKERPKNYPLGEFDAKKWAKEFCRITGFKDEAWAHCWFASAIMTGYDEANYRQMCKCECHREMWNVAEQILPSADP